MTAYQGGHLPRIEEAGHTAQEVKGDLLVMVALHAVCQILHHHSVASQQPLKINAGACLICTVQLRREEIACSTL